MVSTKRNRPSEALKETIIDWFGPACVICGHQVTFDFHHINEDSAQTTFKNLAPLCPTHNAAIERSDSAYRTRIDPEIEPTTLYAKARYYHRVGDFPKAYGCSRIGSYLNFKHGFISDAVDCLVSSMAALRPGGHPVLLRDTCSAFIRIVEKSREPIAEFWKAEFLSRIALVLYDFREPVDAARFDQEAKRFYERTDDPVFREIVQSRKARGVKRSALVHGCVASSHRETRRILNELKEAEQVSAKYQDWEAYGSALWVAASLYSSINRLSHARDAVEQALEKGEKNDIWSHAQLLTLRGKLVGIDSKKRAEEDLRKAASMFRKHKIKPIPIPGNGGLLDSDPALVLPVFGRIDLSPSFPRGASPFSTRLLKEILARSSS